MTQPRIEGYDPGLFDDFVESLGVEGFKEVVGLQWDLISPDRVEAHVEIGPQHLMPYGNVHGGVHCTIVESVASVAGASRVLAEGMGAVGLSNSTDFVRAVQRGRIDAVATPIHVGRTQHLWLVEITDEDGRLVARGQLRMQVIAGGDGGRDGPRAVGG